MPARTTEEPPNCRHVEMICFVDLLLDIIV